MLCDRSKQGARGLWNSLPSVYRRSLLYRFWAAYASVIPEKRHRAVGKETGKHQSYWTLPIILCVKEFSSSSLNSIFKKARKSHWCYWYFYSSLQCLLQAWASLSLHITTTRWKNGYKEVDRYIVLRKPHLWKLRLRKQCCQKRMRTGKCQRPDWLGDDDGEPLETNRHRIAMNVLIRS